MLFDDIIEYQAHDKILENVANDNTVYRVYCKMSFIMLLSLEAFIKRLTA